MKIPAIALALAAVLLVIIAATSIAPARAQNSPTAPANIQSTDGANPGAVTISWNAAADTAFYRIGWVASDKIAAVQAAGRPWLDAFAFTDVTNHGQTDHTLTDLAPGVRYAFIIGNLNNRFGAAQWSEWAYLTLAEAPPTSCLIAPPMPTPTPMATPVPTPTLRPTPTGTGDYDADKDGLIEISNLAQLNAVRADLDGNGVTSASIYAVAFPNAMPGMGCPDADCTGYELVANLDFDTNGNGEADAGDAYWNDGAGWVPIGDEAHKFTANFDGNNHTIANLYINRLLSSNVGLFGYASDSSIVQVGLVSATVSGGLHGGSVGVLVGYSGNSSISDSYTTGSVSGGRRAGLVGGLVGYSKNSSISDSYATGSVLGDYSVGGLVGRSSGTISASYATGSVSGNGSVGGLVGYSSNGTISASYATGVVSGSTNVGGLVGFNTGGISDGYATGGVSGNTSVGGLVGGNRGRGTISASYAMGSVSGSTNVGGLVGFNTGGISDGYAAGSVAGDGDDIGGLLGRSEGGTITASYAVGRVSTSGDTFYIGGLVGYHERGDIDITASYWDTETTGQTGSYGGIGKTTAELQSPTDAAGIYAYWNPEHWDFGNSTQYPVLKYGGLDPAAQRQ